MLIMKMMIAMTVNNKMKERTLSKITMMIALKL